MSHTAFEKARDALAGRLLTRAEFWRRKAEKASDGEKREFAMRALEAQSCAEVAQELSVTYSPPDEPDMQPRAGVR